MHCFSAQMWNPPTCWLTHGVRWNCVTLESARRYVLICILWLFVCMFVSLLECVCSHKCFLCCVYLCMVLAQSDQISHCPISLHVSSSSHSSRDFLPLLPNPQIPLRLLLTSHFSLFLITTLSRYSVLVSDGVCVCAWPETIAQTEKVSISFPSSYTLRSPTMETNHYKQPSFN